jgi:hypothetical protein
MTRRPPTRTLLVWGLLLVLVNLPLVHVAWTRSRGDGGSVSGSGLVVTLVADVVLLGVLLMLVQGRGPRRRTRAQLHAVALGDLERGEPGSALDRIAGTEYLIRGEVADRAADRVVLDLGDRRVVVLLDGHANPVGPQESAQVRGRLID